MCDRADSRLSMGTEQCAMVVSLVVSLMFSNLEAVVEVVQSWTENQSAMESHL